MDTVSKAFAVVFTYSFDKETPVYLFNTKDEAKKFLNESYKEELRIDSEENGWMVDGNIDEDLEYAKIVDYFPDHDDITEFRLGQVYL